MNTTMEFENTTICTAMEYENTTINTSTLDFVYRMNYSPLYRGMSVVINVLIFLVGIVGNVLVVLVVSRTRSMRTPTNCYLVSLAIADVIVLLSATLPAIPETFFQIDEWPFGRVLCSLLIFCQYLGVDTSSMSITAFTVERYIAICHPLRSQTVCTVKRAKRIIAFIWLFAILYCSPWLGLTKMTHKPKLGTDVCTIRLDRKQYLYYYLTDLILFYIIPLVIAAVLYGLIARILFQTNITKNTDDPGISVKHRRRQMTSRLQVVRMLAVIVGIFMVTWMPYRTIVVYNSINDQNKYMDLWFLLFCRTMVYINSAINPILYNAMSVKFRRAFKRILCCGFGTREPHMSVYSELHLDSSKVMNRRTNSELKTVEEKQ